VAPRHYCGAVEPDGTEIAQLVWAFGDESERDTASPGCGETDRLTASFVKWPDHPAENFGPRRPPL